MHRARHVAAASVLAMAMSLGGCGASKTPEAKTPLPEPTSSPSASVTTPTPVAQPKGKFGVTYDVVNWEKYAETPVVTVAKRMLEDGSASLNHKRVLPGVRESVSPALFRGILATYKRGWPEDWYHERVGHLRVQKVVMAERRATLTLCLWEPDTQYFQKDGQPVDPPLRHRWSRKIFAMSMTGAAWRLNGVKTKGVCPGGPPA